MDLKVVLTTFVTIFIAELGDKTQVAAVASASGSQSTISVAVGVVSALALAGLIGVAAGHLLGQWLDPKMLQKGAGILFILMGAWFLWK